MPEFDKDVYCENCGLSRAKSIDYLGRCSDCGKREWVLKDGWMSVEDLAEATGAGVDQIEFLKNAFYRE